MYEYPEHIEKLTAVFRQFPGIGRRAAERIVTSLLDWLPEQIDDFGTLVSELPERIGTCAECGAYCDKNTLCPVCADPKRNPKLLCMVENTAQLMSIECGGRYNGRYLVLGGKISPISRDMGGNLNLELLKTKAFSGTVEEIIMALGGDVESRATVSFITEMLQNAPVKISRPATGLPAGANLSFADAATIAAAFDARVALK